MTEQITIRISGNALDVSPDGKSKLPDNVRAILEPKLQYVYMKLLRGQASYDFTGARKRMQNEIRHLFSYDKYGRFVCGVGFLKRATTLLEDAGYAVTVENCDSPHHRPDRFTEDWDNLVENFAFRAKQDVALARIAEEPRGIIAAPTGMGKTAMFTAVGLLYPKARIAITTKRKDIVQSIRMNLAKSLPNIGQIGGGVNSRSRITVVTADSLHKLDPNDVDILLVDEVHEYGAATYSTALTQFRYARMYGFSASPTGRMDNADMKLESLFGPIIFSMTYQEAVTLGLVVPIRVKWVDVRIEPDPVGSRTDVPRTRWGIWRNQQRNEIIANAAREFGPDDQVLIMVTTFDHAVHLRQHLPEFTLCYAERSDTEAFDRFVKNGMLPENEPAMDARRRQSLRQQFEAGTLKKVIATDVWSTGVSFNELAVLIRGDARGSEIMDAQIPGRVCRLHAESAKQFGLVIDCLDQFNKGFYAAARKRRANYTAKGWAQQAPQPNRLVI